MWDLDINNIGGIRTGKATLTPGLNTVQASNFQGKSSFMAAIRTVVGTTGMFGEDHPLTEGEKSGSVTLNADGDEHEVTLSLETEETITRRGNPYLTDETDRVCAHLFSFLGENNPIRSAVRNGEDLTEYLQAPLNIEDINAQIVELQKKRREIKEDLRKSEQSAKQLPSVQEDITQLEQELEELRDQRDELSAEAPKDTNASDLSDKLGSKQGSLESTEKEIGRLDSKINRREDALEEKQAELNDLEVPSEPELTADVNEKEQRVNDLKLKISLLQDLYRANQQILEEGEVELVTNVDRGIDMDTINCWVCGNDTTSADIEEQLNALQQKINDLRGEKSDIESEVEDIKKTKRAIRKKKNERDQLQDAIGKIKGDIQEAKAELEQAKERKERLESEVEELKAEVEEAEEELNEELTDIKSEISNKERELERKQGQIEDLEAEAEKIDELENKRDELREQIKELRQRKNKKQHELAEEFNDALEDVIDRFAPGFDGGQLVPKTTTEGGDIEEFELKIVRESIETTIDTLSEGEQELVGIVVAIAGYRTFNVDERVPAILIDGISQLSSDNLRYLLEYLEDTSEMLVTTAYPEAGDFEGTTVDPTEWDVVSNSEPATA
ncbi:archaea-specific SMC-related protein [Haloarcula sp. K1]|jgi:DNA repair exonuclease SbcCD ATPase subunit|uniref:archaea-specific SMC-related protein n=1 Tax=Haloarcula sp. K1 TaxID=1622207 RepID=UPI0007BB01EB|nr:archaea-specific SMC-related protein [Haloarcula sp. K1]KZX46301.1 hypothetical protein AV929_16150 [Haloarcula sp. K1]